MIELLSFAVAMLAATALLPAVRTYAARLHLVDQPLDARKVHTEAIPRSGGIAIFLGAAVATLLWMPTDPFYAILIVSVAIVATFGLLDDVIELQHIWKFLPQIGAACLVVWFYNGLPDLPFFSLGETPIWLASIFSVVLIVGITNAINLSDGLDGLAAGNCLFSLGALAVMSWQANDQGYLVIALSVAGAIVGFLRFNTHPASIFMGDLGSQFIGFTAAALCIALISSEQLPVSPLVPVLLFGLPILDTLQVMAIRASRGEHLFKADRNHIHHQLLAAGLRHYEVVTVLYILQAIIVLSAYLLRFESDYLLLGVYGAYAAAVCTGLYLVRRGKISKPQPAQDGSCERRNTWLRKLSWYHKHTAKVIAALVGVLMLFAGYVADPLPANLARYGIPAVGIAIGLWVFLQKYPELVSRTIGYMAAAGAIYTLLFSQASPTFIYYIDVYCICLVLALGLAIRMTRRNVFHLDTQDYLVGIFLIAVPIVLQEYVEGAFVVRLVAYLAVLFYACEYVITKGNKSRWVINLCGIASIGLVAI